MITSGRICTSKQDRLKDADEHVYTSYPTRDALHLFPQLTFFFFFFFPTAPHSKLIEIYFVSSFLYRATVLFSCFAKNSKSHCSELTTFPPDSSLSPSLSRLPRQEAGGERR